MAAFAESFGEFVPHAGRPTRVLHFFRTYWPDTYGGTERMIETTVRGVARYGIDCRVLSLSRDPEANTVDFDGHITEKAGYRHTLAGMEFSLDALAKFRRTSREVDLIHYHYPWPFGDLSHYFVRSRKPYVVTYHAEIVGRRVAEIIYSPLRRRFLRNASALVATSPNMARTSPVLAAMGREPEIVTIGLTDRRQEPDPDAAAKWRQRIPGPFFLFTGVLRYYKGLHVLIEAMRKTPAHLVVLGGGPLEADLQAHAASLGKEVSSRIHFVGALPDKDKYDLLAICRGFVFPSNMRAEALGLALIEAAMFGKPMISCELGTGTSYVNRDGETGFVVEADNADALAGAMRELLDRPDLAGMMGNVARRRYEERFTAEHMVAKYAEIYRRVARQKPVGQS